ncbi:MAG: hypothetical protein ACOY4M_08315 [Pseudomonadota bacterium]
MIDLIAFLLVVVVVAGVYYLAGNIFRLLTIGTILTSEEDMRRRMPPVDKPFEPYRRRPDEDKNPRIIERGIDVNGYEWIRTTCAIPRERVPLTTPPGAMWVETHLRDGTVVYHAELYHDASCKDFCEHSGLVDSKLGRRMW